MSQFGMSQASFGLKAGFNSNKITNIDVGDDEDVDLKRGGGLIIGAISQFGITNNLSFVGELNLIQKSTKFEGSFDFFGEEASFEDKTTFNYLEVPLMIRYSAGSSIKFYGNAGPYVAYAMGGKVKSEFSLGGETESEEGKIKFGKEPDNYMGEDAYLEDTYNRLELGVYLGAGIQTDLGPGSLILDARYGIGLSDLNNTDEVYPNGKPDDYEANKYNNIAVSIGYMINL
jgi:hypothetical protein